MIPVVTHVYGTGARPYVSDVRIANISAVPVTATLVFTRSGDNGLTSFSSADVHLEPGQTAAFDDAVDTLFHTTGSGTLEVLGDVLAMSRTYAITQNGTLGQQVPPNLDAVTIQDPDLIAAPYPELAEHGIPDRFNFGISETGGDSGVVIVRSSRGTERIPILPFSHVQLRSDGSPSAVAVESGDARIIVYVSQLDAVTRDPMFIPARSRRPDPRPLIAPFSENPSWQSALWYTDTAAQVERIGSPGLNVSAVRVIPKPGAFAGTRVRHDGTNQYVPLLPAEGPAKQHLLFIDGGNGYRTNVGIVSDVETLAEVALYDAVGNEVSTGYLSTGGGVSQFMVNQSVVNGRARVRFLYGHGRAYASVIDTRTGDASYFPGQ
jgi:hypothetical protein